MVVTAPVSLHTLFPSKDDFYSIVSQLDNVSKYCWMISEVHKTSRIPR